jgi:hypothetical protein
MLRTLLLVGPAFVIVIIYFARVHTPALLFSFGKRNQDVGSRVVVDRRQQEVIGWLRLMLYSFVYADYGRSDLLIKQLA